MLVAFYIVLMSQLMDLSKCKFEPKIVGGHYVKITEFPHSAFLSIHCQKNKQLEGPDENSSWMCGSSIINQNLLLTAAHCLGECLPTSELLVSVGHVHVLKGFRYSVHSFLVHERYCPETALNDIALVRLIRPLNFSSTVSRVVLSSKPPYGEKAQVAGWGITDVFMTAGTMSTEGCGFLKLATHVRTCQWPGSEELTGAIGYELKSIDQYVWKKKDCIDILRNIPKGAFCASSDKNKDYASGGDSGSALIVRGYLQLGLVSFKKPFMKQNIVVYTDTGYFYNWIEKNAKYILCHGDK